MNYYLKKILYCIYIWIFNVFVSMFLGYKYYCCNKDFRFYNLLICEICEIFKLDWFVVIDDL